MHVNLWAPRHRARLSLFTSICSSAGRFSGPFLSLVLGCSLALSLGLATRSAAADELPVEVEPQVVTAARLEQDLADTLPATTLISRTDIENSQEVDVLSLLQRVAGLEIAQSGGPGAQASIFMRGTNSNQTLVLVDGVPINTVESGGALLQHLMTAEVDHIEVVRGNVSALYGSQAVGGVIQIFTRAGSLAPGATLDLQAGGDVTRNAVATAAARFGPDDAATHAGLVVSSNEAGGFSAINAEVAPFANPDDNHFGNSAAALNLSQNFHGGEIGLRVLSTQSRLSFDDPTDYTFIDPTYDGRNQINAEYARFNSDTLYGRYALSSHWTTSFQIGAQRDHSVDTSSNPYSFDVGTTDSRTNDYSWQNEVNLAGIGRLSGGLDHRDETGYSTSYAATFTRRVDSVNLGYLGNFGPNQIQADARSDRYSDFGTAATGLLGYGFRIDPAWKLIAQASTGFDAPTFDDLYYPGAGNPDLKPEKSRSVDAGIEWQTAAASARLDAFRTLATDLIQFDFATNLPENIARAHLAGFEATANWHDGAWSLWGNATFDRAVDGDTGQRLLRRANHTVNAGGAYDVGPWRFQVDEHAAGNRIDSDINTFAPVTLPGYAVTDLVARYRVTQKTSVSLSVFNAFDRHYSLVDGYNTPGRVVLAGVSTAL